jgi:signal transduction histidine kinase
MLRRLGLGRLGLLGRLVLIVLALLLAFLSLTFAFSLMEWERRQSGTERFPVPAQAAAIVGLLDRTPAAERAAVLKAVSSETFVVRLSDHPPAGYATTTRMPAVEWLVGEYLETLPDRTVLAFRSPRRADGLAGRVAGRRDSVAIAVALSDHRFVVFEIRGRGGRRVFGIPLGFFLGLFGFLFAAAALWAIAREARPLRELARSVERFATGGAPHSVEPRGAPEIRSLIEATNAMQERIAALIKGRTMLLGAVSHDLKTYITRLRLRAETIEPEEMRLRAERDLEEMTRLIDDALAVARGASAPERRRRFDLAAMVTEEIGQRTEDGFRIDSRLPHEPAFVDGDPLALRRVAANLIDNARGNAARCRVSITRRDGAVELIVEDDGPGVPETERAVVFEPFYRLEPSRSRATGGSGLGLAIARQIVEAHGGAIRLDRSELGGARFRVRLPGAAGA